MAAIAARRSSRSRSTWWPRSPATARRCGLPISGIGGITTWRDAAEFMALGAGNVQVCTAAMTYGFKIVEEMISGLVQLDGREGLSRRSTISSAAPRRNVTDWQYLNLNYVTKARIDQDLCIKCGRCHIACEDTSHQAITKQIERRAPLRGDGRRVRRLQSLRQRLPGRGLHHHGAAGGRRRSTSAPASRSSPASTPTGPRTRTTRWARTPSSRPKLTAVNHIGNAPP